MLSIEALGQPCPKNRGLGLPSRLPDPSASIAELEVKSAMGSEMLGMKTHQGTTVDGSLNPAFTRLRLVVYPIIYRVSAPFQVVQDFSHQQ